MRHCGAGNPAGWTPVPVRIRAGRSRRGQTILLALAILFLLTLLGGIFVTLLIRNLQRVTRQGETDDALTLALAGLQYAAHQFRTSPRGADWRPETTEPLWRTPAAGAFAPFRPLDPDFDWLDPGRTSGFPYVRVPTGRGRFLLRVTHVPVFRPASAASEAAGRADLFDRNSQMIHVEVIGRPGEFDPNDPSFLRDPSQARGGVQGLGQFRKIEAYVPVGLVDQLWWITNFTNERGPARLGVPPMENPAFDPNYAVGPNNPQFLEYPQLFEGGIRSNVDIQWHGRNVIRLYPARGEGLLVDGKTTLAPRSSQGGVSAAAPQVRIDILDDTSGGPTGLVMPGDDQNDVPTDDTLVAQVPVLDSANPAFTTIPLQTSGRDVVHVVSDQMHRRMDPITGARSARRLAVPVLNQLDPTTGISRWLLLTRDSGGTISVGNGGAATRVVNAGWYGLTDPSLPPTVRARGLYLPNFADVQYPTDRARVKDEWLQRSRFGWFFNRYVPSVRPVTGSIPREIADVQLTTDANGVPVIRIFRTDPDSAQYNVPPGAPTDPAVFYDLQPPAMMGGPWNLTPHPNRFFKDFSYPENGVFFAEGSIRIRGTIPAGRQLTVVSGGTIYVEGNLLKARADSFLGLLAHDYVTLNPTAFCRVRFNGGASGPDHVVVDQNESLDFTVTDAAGLTSAILHLKHGAMADSTASETAVHLFQPRLASAQLGWPDWTVDRYNFGGNVPPAPQPPTYSGVAQLFYWFHQISPGQTALNWSESNFQTTDASQPTFERKTFFLPQISSDGGALGPGGEARFRLLVQQKDNDPLAPDQQPYLLSRLAMVPDGRPLQIRVEAIVYAFTGSWFVIPPPFFNGDTDDNGNPDSRARFAATLPRVDRTFPLNTGHHPFYNEALNINVQLVGAVAENVPAEASEAAEWVKKMWVYDPAFDHTAFPVAAPPPFSPNLGYRYDANLRRMVRVRYTRPWRPAPAGGLVEEEAVWVAPTPPPAGVPTLAAAVAAALANNSYVQTLPLLPHLPASAVVYEGNPVE